MTRSGNASRTTASTDTTSSDIRAPGNPGALTVTGLRAGEQHVLVVAGEADLYTAGHLRDQLIDKLQSKPISVLVELGALQFCDLPGLDALHDAERVAHDAGVALTYRGMSAQLSWLRETFPPRPLPPPSTPGPAEAVLNTQGAATGAPPTTAPTAGRSSGMRATPRRTRHPGDQGSTSSAPPGDASAVPRPARAAERTDARRPSEPGRRPGASSDYLAGRDGRRRGSSDGLMHAVPASNASRSAACGARAQRSTISWDGSAPDSCPDCAAVIARPSP